MNAFKDIWYTSDDGLRLYARDYGSVDAELTVLCLHGLTRNSADFADLAPGLTDIARVVSVDQRGRGRSDWDTDSANYQPGRYVADMFTLIEQLQLKNIVLLGTSMGGIMSMVMTTRQPDTFKGVILNDIGPEVCEAGLDRIKATVGKSKPVRTAQDAINETANANGIAFPDYQHADWQAWVKRMYEENENGELQLRYDPAIAEPISKSDDNAVPRDPWPLFNATSKLPLLTIRGELSDILEERCVTEMQRRHPGMQYFSVARVGHAPMLDEPGVVDTIRGFLTSL